MLIDRFLFHQVVGLVPNSTIVFHSLLSPSHNNMCDTESPDNHTTVIEDADVIKVDTSPKEPHQMNDMPPVLLASQVINTTTYSTLMYSISRITVFGFQSPIKTTRWTTKLSLLIPTISALAMDLVIIKLNESPVKRENNSTLYWNYKTNAEFRVPALIAGLVSFCKRFFIESLLSMYI